MKYIFNVLFLSLLLVSCDKTECLESNCTGPVPYYLQPVCGCNDITYPNWKTAECYGILNYTEGECESSQPMCGVNDYTSTNGSTNGELQNVTAY